MSDPRVPDAPDELPEAHAAPRRVIGTPPPAEARTMLPDVDGRKTQPERRWLPAGPANPRRAQKAARGVAALFILSTLAGIGFIAAYVGLEVGSVNSAFRSNLALGLSMSVVFLALAAGAVIWVRHIMPDVELREDRHPMASTPQEREAFAET